MKRRALLMASLALAAARAEGIRRGRVLQFPRDHGAHPDSAIEWWYATGWLGRWDEPLAGFQVTFFRSRTGLAPDLKSRFAPRQLLFAHAAVTDLANRRHHHAQRIARWSGDADAVEGAASIVGCDVHIGHWRLHDDGSGIVAALAVDDFALDLRLQRSQALLLQGDAGFSRKGPSEQQASHYVSEPQLLVDGSLRVGERSIASPGRAWLDHEWSDHVLDDQAVGWDWVGFNLEDGSALTAFRLRRADGSALWAGGSWRARGRAARNFGPDSVQFLPGRTWTSPASGATYPVEWRLRTPAGNFVVETLLDEQELDSRTSTGTIYWEGLSELRNERGERIGLGYLELTGYAGRMRL